MSAVGIADVVNQVQVLLGGSATVPVSFGKKQLSTNAAPPQIYVYPADEQYPPAPGAGASNNPQILHGRRIGMEVHCWGSDYGPTEQLVQAFVTAIRIAMQGGSSQNYELKAGRWDDTVNEELGQRFILALDVFCVIPRAQLPFSGSDATSLTAKLTQFQPDTDGLTPGTGTPYWGETQ